MRRKKKREEEEEDEKERKEEEEEEEGGGGRGRGRGRRGKKRQSETPPSWRREEESRKIMASTKVLEIDGPPTYRPTYGPSLTQ